MPCNSTNSRAVPSWCNLGIQIQLKDKCAATPPGEGSMSWFKDLVRVKRAELGNYWHLKYIRESHRTDKTSPSVALCHGHWSYSRVKVKKFIMRSLSIKQSWQQYFTRQLNSLISLNPSAFTLLGSEVSVLCGDSVSQPCARQEVFPGYFKAIWIVIRILP